MDTWLLSRMHELRDLQGLNRLATWDPETYLPAEDRVRQVTGQGLTDTGFLGYLQDTYGALYGVAL